MISTDTVIQATDLTKFYGAILAVDHVNFEVYKGEIFGFIGRVLIMLIRRPFISLSVSLRGVQEICIHGRAEGFGEARSMFCHWSLVDGVFLERTQTLRRHL
jgi:hypothetical protein